MCRRRSARRSSTRSPHRGRGCSTSGAGPDELGAHSWRPMMTTLPSISRSACCASLRVGAIRLALVRRFCRPTGSACRFAMMLSMRCCSIQVVGAAEGWQTLVKEARRVLRPAGALVLGRAVAPESGIDAQMKHRLAMVLQDLGVPSHQQKSRAVLQRSLETEALTTTRALAATWDAERSPGMFLVPSENGCAVFTFAASRAGNGIGQPERMGRCALRVARRRVLRAARVRAAHVQVLKGQTLHERCNRQHNAHGARPAPGRRLA